MDDEHTKLLYSPSARILFAQMEKLFPSVKSKRILPVSLRVHNKPSRRKPAKHKKASRDIISNRNLIVLTQKSYWKQSWFVLASEKELQLIKVITPYVINRLSWYGAVCSRPCFRVKQQQKFGYSGNYKARDFGVSSWTKSRVQNLFA